MSLNTILATAPLTATGYHLKATGTALGQSLIWDNGTNVGIGNTNTSYTLDVSGTGRFTSTLLVSGAATFSDNLTMTIASGTKSIGFGGNTIAAAANALIYSDTNYLVLNSKAGSPLYLNFDNANASSTINMFNGKFILTQPGAATFSSSLNARSNLTGTITAITTSDASGYGVGLGYVSGGYGYVTSQAATSPLALSIDGNPKLYITTTGNVGIGTNSPTYKLQVVGDDRPIIIQAASVGNGTVLAYYNSVSTLRAYVGFGGNNNSLFEVSNNENGAIDFRTNAAFAMRVASGGNVLIGTTTDSSYKLAVASGHQYFGSGFQITGSFGATDRQCATAFADFAGTSVTFDLASLFPRTTFLNRGLSVTMQLVALPTYTIVSSGFVVLARTGNSNVWSNTILANININGASINSVTATGTVITVNYSTYIFGTAYINLATIG